jgi:toxin ParE1/3/4
VSETARAVHLTAAAEADLAEIRTYTEEAWGETQWLAYFGDILEAFERIAVFPQSGRARDAISPGLRSVRCREHVIFYLPDVGGVVSSSASCMARGTPRRWTGLSGMAGRCWVPARTQLSAHASEFGGVGVERGDG